MKKLRTWVGPVLCAVAVPLAATAVTAQTTIGNEGHPALTSHTYLIPTLTFGQTFTAPNPTDVFLQSFRTAAGSNPSLPYTVRLMEWTGATAGAVLFSESVAATPPSRSYVEFNVNTLLNFGAQYIFAVSVAAGDVGFQNYMSLTSTYAGGHEVLIGSTELGTIQGGVWALRPDFDVGFSATFVPGQQQVVPEPMTMVLLGTGLLGLGIVRRRRAA